MKILCLIALLLHAGVSIAATPPQLAKVTGCTLSDNPAVLTTDCTDIQAPNIPIPPVGVEQTSVFGAKYKRITLPSGLTDGAVKQMFPIYARIPAWNADGTKLMLMANNGGLHLFDGSTYEYIELLDTAKDMHYSGTDPEPRWSTTEPNIFYYVYGMQFRSYNISTHKTTIIHTFTDAECGGTGLTMIHNGDEGNSDDSMRYWTWYVQDGTYAHKRVIVYDRQTDTVLSNKGFEAGGLCGANACPTSVNWTSISHSGNHVVICWNLDAPDGVLTARGKGIEVFDKSLNHQNTSSEKTWHSDLTQLADGTDVFVGASLLSGTNGYKAVRAVSLDNGSIKKSCMLPQSLFNHTSGRTRSSSLKGWILYSSYDQGGTGLGITSPGGTFSVENFAINMDTCEVRRIAHTQSNWNPDNYASEPHSSVNFDFTKIVWGSNWRDQDGMIQAYVAELGTARSPLITSIK